MASSVVVSDYPSLVQNFSENAKNVLCAASFGAGAYAIGGRLIGAAALTPPSALLTAGALVTALAVCPSGADQGDIFGTPPNFSGGQCPVEYTISVRLSWVSSSTGAVFAGSASRGTVGLGPFQGLSQVSTGSNSAVARLTFADRVVDFGGQVFPAGDSLVISNIVWENISRVDGLADNCGNAPSSGGQVISNTTTGDTIDNSKVVNNNNFTTVIPVLFNAGGINTTINLSFGPIEIESLFPLKFNIDVGGIGINFKQKPDGDLEPDFSNPDKDLPDNKLQKLLKEIKACVCEPAVDLDMLLLPTVGVDAPCEFRMETLLVPKGSVSPAQFSRFLDTASLAVGECERMNVEQLPESAIYSASTTQDGRELFTGLIEPDIVSLVLRITAVGENGPDLISLYPAANQRKFGSVSFVMDGVEGGGDYIYIYDVETYIPLPKRGKNGRLRILMKRGISFSVFDSGERL